MKVVILGRGNMGAPLAELVKRAGHDVTAVGKEGAIAQAIPGG